MVVLGSMVAALSSLVRIVASCCNAATRLIDIVARNGAAAGLASAVTRSSAADVIKSPAVAMGMAY